MKTLKFFLISFCFIAFLNTSYSQGNSNGNKITFPPMPDGWTQDFIEIPCIGDYGAVLEMNYTVFHTGKVQNKAEGVITTLGDDPKTYAVKSMFNCNVFSARISASVLSNQSWTFRVRCIETRKLVATVHVTFHFDNDGDQYGIPAYKNVKVVCH